MITIRFDGVTFTYDSMHTPLFRELDFAFGQGWTGVVGANGSGKTTLLKLATGALQPNKGTVTPVPRTLHCPQRTDRSPQGLQRLLDSSDPASFELAGRLGVDEDWLRRWDTLSHGERKRAQLAVTLWNAPDVLSVDEPTNHLDEQARELVAEALGRFRGVGILVSHDRRLLDTLCTSILFVEDDMCTMGGGFTDAQEQRRLEERQVRTEMAQTKKTVNRLRREAQRRQVEAQRSASRRSKRGIPIHDHDACFKRNLARLSGKDGQSGRLHRQLQGRLQQAQENLAGIRVRKETRLGVAFSAARCGRDTLLHLQPTMPPSSCSRCTTCPKTCADG